MLWKITERIAAHMRLLKCQKEDLLTNSAALRRTQSRFCMLYPHIRNACRLLCETAPEPDADRLASRYMKSVLRTQQDGAWWREQQENLAQPWFIWNYCLERGLVQPPADENPPPPPLRIIRPEGREPILSVLLTLQRDPRSPDLGTLYAECLIDRDSDALMKQWKLFRSKNIYQRAIDECSAPILDRAAETATGLLESGCEVCFREPGLEQIILNGSYTPEHPYWVREGPQCDQLWLTYPRDPLLHQYVMRAGGRWNGRQMLVSITNADRLPDLIRLYGFRITAEASRRLDAWNEAQIQATIYQHRNSPGVERNVPASDRFAALLNRPPQVPADLCDADD